MSQSSARSLSLSERVGVTHAPLGHRRALKRGPPVVAATAPKMAGRWLITEFSRPTKILPQYALRY